MAKADDMLAELRDMLPSAPPTHAKTLRELTEQLRAEGKMVSKQMMKDRLAELQRQGKWASAREGNKWLYWRK